MDTPHTEPCRVVHLRSLAELHARLAHERDAEAGDRAGTSGVQLGHDIPCGGEAGAEGRPRPGPQAAALTPLRYSSMIHALTRLTVSGAPSTARR